MQKPLHPLEIKLDESKKIISILFNDGKKYSICSELLRVESPSAEVQGHGGPKVLIINKEDVKIIDIKKIGNYAIRITFSDDHSSGIFSWDLLYDFGKNQVKYLNSYYNSL